MRRKDSHSWSWGETKKPHEVFKVLIEVRMTEEPSWAWTQSGPLEEADGPSASFQGNHSWIGWEKVYPTTWSVPSKVPPSADRSACACMCHCHGRPKHTGHRLGLVLLWLPCVGSAEPVMWQTVIGRLVGGPPDCSGTWLRHPGKWNLLRLQICLKAEASRRCVTAACAFMPRRRNLQHNNRWA